MKTFLLATVLAAAGCIESQTTGVAQQEICASTEVAQFTREMIPGEGSVRLGTVPAKPVGVLVSTEDGGVITLAGTMTSEPYVSLAREIHVIALPEEGGWAIEALWSRGEGEAVQISVAVVTGAGCW